MLDYGITDDRYSADGFRDRLSVGVLSKSIFVIDNFRQ